MLGVEYGNRRVPCRLVVLDKDGTLTDFTATWVPLIRKRTTLLVGMLGRDRELESSLLKSWGIDPVTGMIDPRGPCPVALRSEEIVVGALTLYQHGYPWDESKQWVTQAFEKADIDSDRRDILKPVNGIEAILHRLKQMGFLLALATIDERKDTETILSHLGMDCLFDVILCAEEVKPPKPHPQTIHTICHRLSISPQETILIGDTLADMMMGKSAGVALTIGVLEGGITPRQELEKVADLVVNSIQDLKFFK
ncbi:MAG: HAD family hydrolase [Thermodesulfobacteriota bacterium]